jgi:hypothetical protein
MPPNIPGVACVGAVNIVSNELVHPHSAYDGKLALQECDYKKKFSQQANFTELSDSRWSANFRAKFY